MTAAVTVLISILALTIPGLILAMFGLGRHTHLMDIGTSYRKVEKTGHKERKAFSSVITYRS